MRDFSSCLDDGVNGRIDNTIESENKTATKDVLVWSIWMCERDEVRFQVYC